MTQRNLGGDLLYVVGETALGRMPIVLATFTCSGENVIDL